MTRSDPSSSARGVTLVEMLVVLAIIGMTVAASVPAFLEMRRAAAMRVATRELRATFHLVRMRAISRSRNSAVKFRKAGSEWQYAIYDDGDFDGVRNDDINSGIDPLAFPFRRALQGAGSARIGIPAGGTTHPDTGDPLNAGDSPVRFNASTLCSFSPTGSGTPGTVFLTDGATEIGAVRVLGATGRIRAMRFNRALGRWEDR